MVGWVFVQLGRQAMTRWASGTDKHIGPVPVGTHLTFWLTRALGYPSLPACRCARWCASGWAM